MHCENITWTIEVVALFQNTHCSCLCYNFTLTTRFRLGLMLISIIRHQHYTTFQMSCMNLLIRYLSEEKDEFKEKKYRKYWKVSRAYINFMTFFLRVYFQVGLLFRGHLSWAKILGRKTPSSYSERQVRLESTWF